MTSSVTPAAKYRLIGLAEILEWEHGDAAALRHDRGWLAAARAAPIPSSCRESRDRHQRNTNPQPRQGTPSRDRRGRRIPRAVADRLEREAQIGRGLKPIRGLLLEAVTDNARERFGDGGQRGDVRRLDVQRRVHRVDRRITLEGATSRKQFVEDAAKGKNVSPMIDGAAPHLLRRHVAGRAQHRPRAREATGHRRHLCGGGCVRLDGGGPGETEVENLHLPVVQDEDVVGLEIAMHDAACMRRFEPARSLRRDGGRLLRRQRTAADQVAQRLAFEQFGDGVVHAVVAAEIVNREDVGMRERGDGARFAFEPRDAIRVGADRGRQHLECDIAPQLDVMRAVDLTHSARAEQADDLVTPEARAGGDAHLRMGWMLLCRVEGFKVLRIRKR